MDGDHPERPAGAPSIAESPARLATRNWMRVGSRLLAVLGRENFTLIAAGVAFYGVLALAPSLAALAAIYGLVADTGAILQHLEMLRDVAPSAAYDVIADQARAINEAGRGTLGWVSLGAALLAVFSARAGVGALMIGVGVAYHEREGRSLVMNLLATYLLTLCLFVVASATIALLVVIPTALALLSAGEMAQTLTQALRWPVAMLMVMFGLGVLYRFGPKRRHARREWITPGSALALVLWLAGSAAFSVYLSRFASYNETYGALGAVAALMMWFWLSALSALIGAALNAELELETAADTTVGRARPMGQRGAFVADNVAPDNERRKDDARR